MKIAVIDKHPISRAGLVSFLNNRFKNVHIIESESITTFQKDFSDQNPDLIILGINQSANAININFITMESKGKKPFTGHVIVYDEKPNFSMITHYLKAGLRGYLTKQNSLDEIETCILEVLKGKRYVNDEVMQWILESYYVAGGTSRDDNFPPLTRREYEIARYLIANMKTSEIAKTLGVTASTVSTIKNTIFKKLDVDNISNLREVIQPRIHL
ncbi:response regulator transcription factor [Dyadobacter sp. NIV53]|uniref:response regulator transcription factor n=1 Tax=Dyadobacter sp. NIV53 TaxID=2861765 RepID=UPI001C871F16|nr:response regulator transcription factor [Dyadobacter sp. NIV53]